MKNNKGITLIALVITIIVMLILVGVTISAAINGKLFDTAKKAAKDTEKAKQEEIEDIKNVEDKIDEILGVTTNDKVEDIISKPVEGETEVYAIIFSDGTMELRKEKPTETENVVFKTDESFSNKLFKSQEEIPWISYVDSIKEVKIADEIVPRTTARWAAPTVPGAPAIQARTPTPTDPMAGTPPEAPTATAVPPATVARTPIAAPQAAAPIPEAIPPTTAAAPTPALAARTPAEPPTTAAEPAANPIPAEPPEAPSKSVSTGLAASTIRCEHKNPRSICFHTERGFLIAMAALSPSHIRQQGTTL